jgi:uncharacterized membrane protein YkvA (DUF1232 family)
MSEDKFTKAYSETGFWDKVKRFAKIAGVAVLEPALKMYYAAIDPDTPAWAKGTMFAALGYFISPIDAIPDITPLIGFSDDLGVLCAALATTAAHIKAEHVEKAKATLAQWFAAEDQPV